MNAPPTPLVVRGTFVRRRRMDRSVAFTPPAAASGGSPPLPAKVARMLALAYHIQDAIDRGMVQDRATVAGELGISRPRMTQVLELLLLAPDLQERVLDFGADMAGRLTEKSARAIARVPCWNEQRRRWREQERGR